MSGNPWKRSNRFFCHFLAYPLDELVHGHGQLFAGTGTDAEGTVLRLRYQPETVSTDFYGTVYSSSGVRWVQPDSIQIFVPAGKARLTRYDTPEGIESPVYDMDKLETKDKYSMFLGGNTSRLTIRTGSEGGKLLVIRDSYADCELPFFFDHYAEIHVLDLRYYRQSVSAYALEGEFDAILISYSLADFVTDTSVFLMGT